MTVTAGRTARRAANPAMSAFARLGMTGPRPRRSPGIRWAAMPVTPRDPIDLFAAARAAGLEAALWLQPAAGRSIVGIGRAWATEPGGPDRFDRATAAWRDLLADADAPADVDGPDGPGGSDAGPRLLGGLGFSGRVPAADDPWAAFGPASLVLPTYAVVGRGSTSTLTVTAGPGQPGIDPDGLEARWRALDRTVAEAGSTTGGGPAAEAARPAGRDGLSAIGERPDRAAWDRIVGLFAGAVGRGRIDKVVLARRVILEASAEFDVVAALRHLAATAPESTTFAFVRGGTAFVGATPERLVRTVGRSFETVAIAGSAPRGDDPAEDARLAAGLLSSEKDREEHAVVVTMLRDSLRPIAATLDVAAAPRILPLRHVQHLETPVGGTLRDEAGLLALARQLHPTPAVGGAPREMALALIDEHEGFDRGWYAGPVGWLGADGDGELMVALRCGLVAGRQATLFAGCGIVADSDSSREWDESNLKLRTMIRALDPEPEPAR